MSVRFEIIPLRVDPFFLSLLDSIVHRCTHSFAMCVDIVSEPALMFIVENCENSPLSMHFLLSNFFFILLFTLAFLSS